MEPDMESSRDERAMQANQLRVTRDYCFMRMEILSESSALNGISVEDIKEISKDFHAAQLRVLESLSKAERSVEFAHTVSFDKRFISLKSRIMQASQESLSSNKKCTDGLAKLPKITMKPFDGTLESWVSFKELYDSLIHNRELAEVEKLHYLFSSVQGTAYDLIKNFPLTGSSYKAAYQALHKYYDRKRNIATTYYDKLLKCESVRNKSGSELERIHRTFSENLAILSRYELPNQDFMLFQLVWSKLDLVTREAFELQLRPDVDIPLVDDIMDFLDRRSRALENCYGYHSQPKQVTSRNRTALVVPEQHSCEFCPDEGHTGEACPTFLNLSPASRFKDVKDKRLCILCLHPSHSVKRCMVKVLCGECNQRHHTLLHFEEPAPTLSTSQEHEEASPVALAAYSSHAIALFPTAVALVKNGSNQLVKVRILLDSASACNFITLSCARRLGLKVQSKALSVNGVGRVSTNTLGSVKCELRPQVQDSSSNLLVEAAVLQNICQDMPAGQIDVSSWEHLKGLDLADPEFNTPGPVDMLVSVNILSSALKPGLIKGGPGQAIAISTVFGWIVMGECTIGTDLSRLRNNPNIRKDCFLVSKLSLGYSVKESWKPGKVDSPKASPFLSTTEPTVMSRYIKLCDAKAKHLPVGQPVPLIETQDGSPSDCRHHVSTVGIPVDHSSRGLLPVEWTLCQSWRSGPCWIANPTNEWPQTSLASIEEPGLEKRKVLGSNIILGDRTLNRSSLSRIVNILGHCFRFYRNLRLSGGSTRPPSTIMATGTSHTFVEPIGEHPLLLLRDCRLAHRRLDGDRRRSLNPGPQTLQNLMVPAYCIIRTIRSMLLSCVTYFRAEPRLPALPLVAILPSCHVDPIKPFSSSSFDIALGRGVRSTLSLLTIYPYDLVALISRHFLTLEPHALLAEASSLENPVNCYRRWRLQKMKQDFWARWHLEYKHTLPQRHRWVNARDNIVFGTFVLPFNEQCSPIKWMFSRVIRLKLCVLSVPQDVESDQPSI